MLVKDVMAKDLACCTPQQTVVDAAKMMKQADVGSIPVVDSLQSKKLVGIITDRDICVNVVAEALDARVVKVEKCMSKDLVTAKPDEALDRCAQLMQENQVRRIPVVDDKGIIVGIVAQADIASEAESPETVKETVEQVSRPGKRAAA